MVIALVLLPALAGTSLAGKLGGGGSGADPGPDLRQGRAVRRRDAGRRPTRHPLAAALRRPYRVAGAVPPRRLCHRAGRRLRRGQAVRRLLRARRLLRRHGAVGEQAVPARGRGSHAAARRLRGAVLRLGRHVVRPRRAAARPARRVGHGADHRRRQVGRGLWHRARLRPWPRHGADHRGVARADRRILLHPGRARRRRWRCCRRKGATWCWPGRSCPSWSTRCCSCGRTAPAGRGEVPGPAAARPRPGRDGA